MAGSDHLLTPKTAVRQASCGRTSALDAMGVKQDSSGSFNYDKMHYHPVLVASIP